MNDEGHSVVLVRITFSSLLFFSFLFSLLLLALSSTNTNKVSLIKAFFFQEIVIISRKEGSMGVLLTSNDCI